MSAHITDLFAGQGMEIHNEFLLSDLTVLSMGVGQDSMTILFKIQFDPIFRAKFAPGRLIVLFADTGDENPETYSYKDRVLIPFCIEHGIEFKEITNNLGYHGQTWLTLQHQWENGIPTVGSLGYVKSCSHQLKVLPQMRFMEDWLFENYPETVTKKSRKAGFTQFAKRYGKLRWLIGFARGEETRVKKPDPNPTKDIWMHQSINFEYPLIEEGMGRQDCHDYINSIGHEIPWPSNCCNCMYGSTGIELLWLYKQVPDKFYSWVEHEQKKLDAWSDKLPPNKNIGVCAKIHKSGERKGHAVTLLDSLEEAKEKYGHLTLDELNEYRFSHGHCVTSQY